MGVRLVSIGLTAQRFSLMGRYSVGAAGIAAAIC